MQAGRNVVDEIAVSLREALTGLVSAESLPSLSLGRPSDPSLGDLSSNAAFVLAKSLRKPPLDLAREIASRFQGPADVLAAAPGFLNFTIHRERLIENLVEVESDNWSRSDAGGASAGGDATVDVEYVSANPTGPLHVGHGRGAVIGDAIARLLAHCGWRVTREYYLNDVGRQIDLLGESVLVAARKAGGLDSGGWTATYPVDEVAAAWNSEGRAAPSREEAPGASAEAAAFAKKMLFDEILRVLSRLSIGFDVVVEESTLHGAISGLIAELRERGMLYEAAEAEGDAEKKRRADSKAAQHAGAMEGGTFLRTSRFGDETDRIILRASGAPTYFTADIVYHREKFRRGFRRLINIWGADHGGHVKRLQAALDAVGLPGDSLEVVLCQMVRLLKGGLEVRMSKRSGNVVTLEELIDEVGADAVRFFFLARSPNSQFDFDLDLAVKQSADNPVYYCQYAHARANQLLARGKEERLTPSAEHLDLLTHPTEIEILRRLIILPETIRAAALRLEPHRLADAATDLAQVLHRYQTAGKEDAALRIVRADAAEVSAARLYLVRGVGVAMKKLLTLMGVSAPERM
jgi:arginyl-tRNA synthetase